MGAVKYAGIDVVEPGRKQVKGTNGGGGETEGGPALNRQGRRVHQLHLSIIAGLQWSILSNFRTEDTASAIARVAVFIR